MKKTIIVTILALSTLCCLASVSAEDSRVHGEIQFEQDVKKRKSYEDTQEEVISVLEKLSKFSADPSDNLNPADFNLASDHYLYLNSLYLYCAVRRGTCPEVLDTVLEMDIIQSKLDGTPHCKTMKRFWKSWIENDMQKRHQFQVKTGYIKKTETFQKNSLPKYLRCSKTVADSLNESTASSNIEFFKERYKLPSTPREAITDTLGSAGQAKKSNTNVIHAVGAR